MTPYITWCIHRKACSSQNQCANVIPFQRDPPFLTMAHAFLAGFLVLQDPPADRRAWHGLAVRRALGGPWPQHKVCIQFWHWNQSCRSFDLFPCVFLSDYSSTMALFSDLGMFTWMLASWKLVASKCIWCTVEVYLFAEGLYNTWWWLLLVQRLGRERQGCLFHIWSRCCGEVQSQAWFWSYCASAPGEFSQCSCVPRTCSTAVRICRGHHVYSHRTHARLCNKSRPGGRIFRGHGPAYINTFRVHFKYM